MKKGGLGGVFFPKNSTKIGDKKKHPWLRTKGGDKNRRRPTLPHFTAVPSALWGLTSLFEMGRGEHPSYRLHILIKVAASFCWPLLKRTCSMVV